MECIMYGISMVTQYTNMPQDKVLQMPHDLYLLNFKYAFIEDKMKTEEGREYLKQAYRLEMTEPDYDKLKQINGYKPVAVNNDIDNL